MHEPVDFRALFWGTFQDLVSLASIILFVSVAVAYAGAFYG